MKKNLYLFYILICYYSNIHASYDHQKFYLESFSVCLRGIDNPKIISTALTERKWDEIKNKNDVGFSEHLYQKEYKGVIYQIVLTNATAVNECVVRTKPTLKINSDIIEDILKKFSSTKKDATYRYCRSYNVNLPDRKVEWLYTKDKFLSYGIFFNSKEIKYIHGLGIKKRKTDDYKFFSLCKGEQL